jgi:protein FAM50
LTPQNGPLELPPKKKKKKAAKGLLSFGDDEEDSTSGASTPAHMTSQDLGEESPDTSSSKAEKLATARRLTPNPNAVLPAPKVMTKAALQAEAVARDNLRREFLALQEAVKATEILIPFVFYDGTNIPGGTVKVKKGDHIWLFLDRCRKVGAELGVAGGGAGGTSNSGKSKNDSRREWARVGVDDLMLVRGELIIPHVSISPIHCRIPLANSPVLALRVLLLHCQSCTQHLQIGRSFVRLLEYRTTAHKFGGYSLSTDC